jgi:hypothetical protein
LAQAPLQRFVLPIQNQEEAVSNSPNGVGDPKFRGREYGLTKRFKDCQTDAELPILAA